MLICPTLKTFVDNNLNVALFMIIKEKFLEKEKILVATILSFSYNVIKRHLFKGCERVKRGRYN